jgi:hypothetical protein
MATTKYNLRRGAVEAVLMFVVLLAPPWISPFPKNAVWWGMHIFSAALWSVLFAIMCETFMTHLFPKLVRRSGARKNQQPKA